MSDKLSWKKYLLVRSEISELCLNTLTAYHMYSRQNWEKFPQQVQMKLSSKPLIFFQILISFFKATKKLSHFEKKVQLHTLNIPEVVNSEECGYLNAWKLQFQNTLRKSMCSRVPNIAETFTAALLSWFSNNFRATKFEKISHSHIWNRRIVF